MEQLILKMIDLVKHVSKRKVSLVSILQRINKTSVTNLHNKTLKLELDQMIIKGLISQNYKILDRDRLHLDNYIPLIKLILPSPMRMETTQKNLDDDLPLINNTQETLLMKFQVSFNNPKSETPLILNNQKELDNM